MARRFLAFALLAGATISAPATIWGQTVPNALGTQITGPGELTVSRAIDLGLNQNIMVDLEASAADVVIANPDIADAVVQTSRRIIFRGVKIGQTNALIFGRNGEPLLELSLNVIPDLRPLETVIRRQVPDARVKLETLNGSIIISGTADNAAMSDEVRRLVAAYFPPGEASPQIVNLLNVRASDQVLLEVRVVEMQRSVIKQLGLSFSGRPGFGEGGSRTQVNSVTGQISSTFAFPIQSQQLAGITGGLAYSNFVDGNLQSQIGAQFGALERIGAVRTLAEPTIVAMSGESAKFLAGGEFPVPVGQDQEGRVQVEFKPFGIGLSFTPVVLSEGRISLKISTEVSELTNQGALQAAARTVIVDGQPVLVQGLTLPALTVRRAESVVELPSGGSMMMAGLISVKDRQSLDQLPGIKKLPVLGALFQSRDFQMDESELVVIVTPYLVDPTSKSALRSPADGFVAASDAKTIFFGKLNATYGRDGTPVKAEDYRAPVGFIEE